jgi:hypothetical protein
MVRMIFIAGEFAGFECNILTESLRTKRKTGRQEDRKTGRQEDRKTGRQSGIIEK